MKKVLIIAHAFPPLGIVGALRPFKFAKYLPDFGWEPVVLSAKIGRHVKEIDESLLDQLKPCVKIHRVSGIGPRQLYEKYSARKNRGQSGLKKTQNKLSGKNGLIIYLKRFWETWIEIPDRHIGWFPFALFKALRIMRNQNINVIYSTSDPYTSHLVALFIKKITKKPWVADFRDPWTQYHLYEYHSAIRKRIDEKFEYQFLKKADEVTVTSNLTGNGFVDKYQYIDREKIATITNGIDYEDFINLQSKPLNSTFTISFAGSFWSVGKSQPFINAISEIMTDNKDIKNKIKIKLIGIVDRVIKESIEKLKLGGVIECLGYIPHRECLQELSKSHILLLTRSDERGNEVIIPAKLFEYLAIRRSILALIPEGEASKIIYQTKSGMVIPPNDISKIKRAILNFYNEYKKGSLHLEQNRSLNQYERRLLTKKLSLILNNLSN
ncbi:MAG: glycosyltransferase [Bacteroidetes bacterium]|nr:glycosyltransferase [Bacteroidota bacterium]